MTASQILCPPSIKGFTSNHNPCTLVMDVKSIYFCSKIWRFNMGFHEYWHMSWRASTASSRKWYYMTCWTVSGFFVNTKDLHLSMWSEVHLLHILALMLHKSMYVTQVFIKCALLITPVIHWLEQFILIIEPANEWRCSACVVDKSCSLGFYNGYLYHVYLTLKIKFYFQMNKRHSVWTVYV